MAAPCGTGIITFGSIGTRGKYGSNVPNVSPEWAALSVVSGLGLGRLSDGLLPKGDVVGNVVSPLDRVRVFNLFVGAVRIWNSRRVLLAATDGAIYACVRGVAVYPSSLLVPIALDFPHWCDRDCFFSRS